MTRVSVVGAGRAAAGILAAVLLAGGVAACGSSTPAATTPSGAASSAPTPDVAASPSPSVSSRYFVTELPRPSARPTMGVRTLPPSLRPTLGARVSPGPSPVRSCALPSGPQTFGGRSFVLSLPAGKAPAPVVFDFHGGSQSAQQELAYSGLAQQGPLRGYVVVTPEGTNGLWNLTGAEPGLPDDVASVQRIALLLVAQGCSNGKVYTTGISDGADLAVLAACRLPEVRAVYAVAPSITPRGTCTPKPYVEVHGDADPVVPYTGSAAGSFGDVPSEPVATRLAFWTVECTAASGGTRSGTTVQAWSCPQGRTVELDTVPGGGHTWPGAAPNPALGATAPWSGSVAALSFFGAH